MFKTLEKKYQGLPNHQKGRISWFCFIRINKRGGTGGGGILTVSTNVIKWLKEVGSKKVDARNQKGITKYIILQIFSHSNAKEDSKFGIFDVRLCILCYPFGF